MVAALDLLNARIVACRACPRLVAWREASAAAPPRRFRGQEYWARPIPGFGDPEARVLIVGLAPAAHGGNRTGRVFTGDASGDFLFSALFRAGLANQPRSISRTDGLALKDVYVAAAVRCAPPDNRPTPEEFGRCRPYLDAEIGALPNLRVLVALGALAFSTCLRSLQVLGQPLPRPLPAFSHGSEVRLGKRLLLGSYHVSQQNTNTGRLTPAMLDGIWARVRREVGTSPSSASSET
jgi:uracil-DNA glycosylase family 4